MTDQTSQVGKAVFVGNIKGGVGKSTIAVYLTDYLRQRFAERSIMMIDTDPQGSAFEMLEPHSNGSDPGGPLWHQRHQDLPPRTNGRSGL